MPTPPPVNKPRAVSKKPANKPLTAKEKQIAGDRAVTPGKVLVKGTAKGSGIDPRYDQSKPGVGEQAYANHGDVFFQPGSAQGYQDRTGSAYETQGQGERVGNEVSSDFQRGSQGSSAGQDYWEGVSGRMQSGGPGYTKDAYDQFKTDVDPGLDKYYDAAFSRTQRKLDRSAASRGRFNSSEAMRGVSEAATNLDAEQANREADYRLRRGQALMGAAQATSQDELGWTRGLGDLAFGAGQEKLAYGQAAAGVAGNAQQLEQQRLSQGYNAAMGLDQFGVSAAATGMDAANAAQDQRDDRIQGRFNNQITVGDRVGGIYGDALARDAEYAAQQAGTGMSAATDKYNIEYANAQQTEQKRLAQQQAMTEWMSQYGANAGGSGAASGSGSGTNRKAP